jgi:hypothetical protein
MPASHPVQLTVKGTDHLPAPGSEERVEIKALVFSHQAAYFDAGGSWTARLDLLPSR